ncbi:MAG: hypothetical protein JNM52_02535 [Betaproteobacteria bacterium]|nr:hypothetical protein [Betaproteobacteria bacterium]
MKSIHHMEALKLIQRCSQYVEPAPGGLEPYAFWISSAEEATPGITAAVREAALGLLKNRDEPLTTSALQALACTGEEEDVEVIMSIQKRGRRRLFSMRIFSSGASPT